jgi:hypothetical protein
MTTLNSVMKKLAVFVAFIGFGTFAFAQGQMNWNNTSSTLITDAAIGGPMPVRVSPQTTYNFGLFVAPFGTPAPLPGMAGVYDPNWQSVVAYTLNSTAATGAGRMQNPGLATVPGYASGSTVSFVIRGWQSFSGGTDWEAAKPGLFNYGQSELGYLILGGGALPSPSAFGTVDSPNFKQVGGFVIGIPEPSTVALTGLGLLGLRLGRRACKLNDRVKLL